MNRSTTKIFEEPREGKKIYYEGTITTKIFDDPYNFDNKLTWDDNPSKEAAYRDFANWGAMWMQKSHLLPQNVTVKFDGEQRKEVMGDICCDD